MGTVASMEIHEAYSNQYPRQQAAMYGGGGYPPGVTTMEVAQVTFHKRMPEQPPQIIEKPDPIVIDEEMVDEYVCLESKISQYEKTKPLQRLEALVKKMQKLSMEIKTLEEKLQQLQTEKVAEVIANEDEAGKDLLKEIDGINEDVKNNNSKIGGPDDRINKQKEVIMFELKEKQKQFDLGDKELEELNVVAADLLDCYYKQDEILVSMFCKGHASQKEAELCQKLGGLEEKRERIERARRDWKEAQLLLEYSCKKLACAVQQWQNLPECPKICLEVRYSLSESVERKMREQGRSLELDEEFNNLPNCTPEELAALEALATGDSRSKNDERFMKCMDNYSESCKRGMAIIEWFRKVLNTTMYRTLVEVCDEVRTTSQAVRVERLNVLKQNIKKTHGHNLDIDSSRKITTEEDIKKVVSGYKAKVDAKKNARNRRGSQASLDKAVRRGSRDKLTPSTNHNFNGMANQKAKTRMQQNLAAQLKEQKELREKRQASAMPLTPHAPPGPPPATTAPTQLPTAVPA